MPELGQVKGFVGTRCLQTSEPLAMIPVSGPEHEFKIQARTVPLTSVATIALNEFIGFEISLVPQVEAVFTAFRNEVFYVWVIVSRFEEETLGQESMTGSGQLSMSFPPSNSISTLLRGSAGTPGNSFRNL